MIAVVLVGKVRLVFCRMSFTSCCVSVGLMPSIKLTMPVTCAVETLVPNVVR